MKTTYHHEAFTWCLNGVNSHILAACSVGWFVSLLVREEVLLAGLCERKILFRLKIYDRLRQATAKQTGRRRKVGKRYKDKSMSAFGCV